jgi:hypothetical protein
MPFRHIRTGAVLPLVLLLMAAGARADTAVQPGLWETTEKVTLDGNDLPSEGQRGEHRAAADVE